MLYITFEISRKKCPDKYLIERALQEMTGQIFFNRTKLKGK